MEYFEKIINSDKYCYFVQANEPSIPGSVHEIACFPHLHNNIEFLFIYFKDIAKIIQRIN